MANIIRNKRRPKLITPSNSSFSHCVQDQIFSPPLRRPLETFKPVLYLDEQGRRHGRVSDHLLQQQIEQDRQRLKRQPVPRVTPSSTLYGIRNPNIAALIRDVPAENDEDEDEDKLRADDEVKFIEYKRLSKPATSKSGNRRISTISGKQSVKFDTTPSVDMARLAAESHLTELDDIDDVDDDESENEDEEELDSTTPMGKQDTSDGTQTKEGGHGFSETPATTKYTNDEEEQTTTEPTSNSALDENRPSQEIQMPPTVEDILDEHEGDDDEQQKPRGSEEDLLSPSLVQRRKQSARSSERPKTASSGSRMRLEESRASRSSSTASDDTSALLRSDDDHSPNISDNDLTSDDEEPPIKTPIQSDPTSPEESDISNVVRRESLPPQLIRQISPRDIKGEYDPEQVIQLKESFQPIINEAASYGHLDIVRKLIERGQSVHTQNLLQRTPLHEACVSGHAELVSELLNNGALIDQRDSRGMTPLHVAASHGTVKCIQMLCEKGCDVNAQDDLGQTPAHYSAMHDHVEALKYLINKRNANLSISNKDSKLPIHYAAKHGSKNVLSFFFRSILTIYATDQHGNTIAHEASESNQLECMKLIWKLNRTLLTKKNHLGRTPNHTAALHGSSETLHWLLEQHIMEVDEHDNDGYTMAHLAASRGHGECISCLLMHGAQLDLYTFDRHESVVNVAKRSGKNGRFEQARSGVIRCRSCEEKLSKDKYNRAHARNAVEQLIHTQIQRGYHLNIPVNRSSTNLSQRPRAPT